MSLLNFFLKNSCMSFKKTIKTGWVEALLLFLFICLFFSIGKLIATIVSYMLKIFK